MIRGVVFDLGSTLIRFEGEWSDVLAESRGALVEALRALGIEVDPVAFSSEFHRRMRVYYEERETEFIEFTTAYVLRAVLADFRHPSVPEEVVRRALHQMYAITELHWRPMPEVYRILDELQQAAHRLGLISNSGDEANVQRLIDRARLRPYFDPILISAGMGLRKPNPAVFQRVLQAWKLRPDQVVMVGDSLGADILGAQNAGLHHIWLTAQADTPANRAHADTIIPEATARDLAQVPDLIRQMSQRRSPRQPG